MDGQLAALYSVVRFWSRRLGFPPIWPVSVPQILTAPCLWAVCYGCSEMGFQHDWMEFLTIARSESLDSVSVVISQLLWGHNFWVNTYFMYFYVILCPHVVFWRALAIDMRFGCWSLVFFWGSSGALRYRYPRQSNLAIPCPVSERADGGLTSMCRYYVLDENTMWTVLYFISDGSHSVVPATAVFALEVMPVNIPKGLGIFKVGMLQKAETEKSVVPMQTVARSQLHSLKTNRSRRPQVPVTKKHMRLQIPMELRVWLHRGLFSQTPKLVLFVIYTCQAQGIPSLARNSCTEAVHSVALWTRVTLRVWTCVKYVPKQSSP